MTTKATIPLYTAQIPLGLGHTATVEIVEIDPLDAPSEGVTWDASRDWPRARLAIRLPSGGSRYYSGGIFHDALAPDLRGAIKVLDSELVYSWGTSRTVDDTAEYLDELVAKLCARARADLAPLVTHVAARAVRLAEREATLERGRRGRQPVAGVSDMIDRPIELDAAPRTIAVETATDDTSQRMALLECHESQPARSKRTKKAA